MAKALKVQIKIRPNIKWLKSNLWMNFRLFYAG